MYRHPAGLITMVPNMIIVGSTNKNARRSLYSQKEFRQVKEGYPYVVFHAPGEDVIGPEKESSGYVEVSGTSYGMKTDRST